MEETTLTTINEPGPSKPSKRPAESQKDEEEAPARRPRLHPIEPVQDNQQIVEINQDLNENPDLFIRLPDEVVVQIMSCLSTGNLSTRVCLVNRRFSELSQRPELWQTVHISPSMDARTAIRTIDSRNLLKKLIVSTEQNDGSEFLVMYALQYCRHLKDLELRGTEIHTDFLTNTFQTFGSNLRKLKLYSVLGSEFDGLPNLTHLDVKTLLGNSNCLRYLADGCRQLQYLSLEILEVGDGEMNYFLDSVQATLKSLVLERSRHLTDKSFRNVDKCQLLERLEIDEVKELAEEGIASLSKLPRLQSFLLPYNNAKTEDFIRAFSGGKTLENLTKLSIPYCVSLKDDQIVQVLVKSCPNLVHLHIDSEVCSDDTFLAIADHCCNNLESFIYSAPVKSHVTNEAINYFLDKLKITLKYLVMPGCCLNDDTLRTLGKCSLLEKLMINSAKQFVLSDLQLISKCPLLNTLGLRKTKTLSSSDFVVVFSDKRFERLTCLDLESNFNLDDKGLIAIANNCPNLERLNVQQCRKVTSEGIRQVLSKCGKLRKLGLNSVDLLTPLTALGPLSTSLKGLFFNAKYWSTEKEMMELRKIAPYLATANLLEEDLWDEYVRLFR